MTTFWSREFSFLTNFLIKLLWRYWMKEKFSKKNNNGYEEFKVIQYRKICVCTINWNGREFSAFIYKNMNIGKKTNKTQGNSFWFYSLYHICERDVISAHTQYTHS